LALPAGIDGSGTRVSLISPSAYSTEGLFSLTFLASPDSDPAPDLIWFAQGSGLAPAGVLLTNPTGAGIAIVASLSGPECANGLDDDQDGSTDLADPGCSDAADTSERSPSLPCDNGLDDDGDGRADFDPETFADPAFVAGYGDPACKTPSFSREDAKCQNGISDDTGIGTDFDGGESILGVGNGDPNGPDPQCVGKPWLNDEKAPTCGLGAELLLALGGLKVLLARRSTRRA
jgi:hypothetical protein